MTLLISSFRTLSHKLTPNMARSIDQIIRKKISAKLDKIREKFIFKTLLRKKLRIRNKMKNGRTHLTFQPETEINQRITRELFLSSSFSRIKILDYSKRRNPHLKSLRATRHTLPFLLCPFQSL